MKREEHLIWDSDMCYDEDFIAECKADIEECNCITLTDAEAFDEAIRLNNDYLDDERANLGHLRTDGDIICIGSLGLWNGRKTGYKLLNTRKITDCLYSLLRGGSVSDKWTVDRLGDLRCREGHHDGVNYYLYRELKPELSEQQRENFLEKIYNGLVNRRDINRYTKRLGDRIGKVYGWAM